MTGEWRDEDNNLLDLDPPGVNANYEVMEDTYVRGNILDLLYQADYVYILYKH